MKFGLRGSKVQQVTAYCMLKASSTQGVMVLFFAEVHCCPVSSTGHPVPWGVCMILYHGERARWKGGKESGCARGEESKLSKRGTNRRPREPAP